MRASGLFRVTVTLGALIVAMLAVMAGSVSVQAATPGPGWMTVSDAAPTAFKPGDASGDARYIITARNVGSAATDGTPFTITDRVSAGLTITSVNFEFSQFAAGSDLSSLCTNTQSEASCGFPEGISSSYPVAPEEKLVMTVHVSVDPSALGPVTSHASITGGGAAADSVDTQNVIALTDLPFGIASTSMRVSALDGSQDNQAGDHPYETTTSFYMNTLDDLSPSFSGQVGEHQVKDTIVDLPPGIVGNPGVTPKCTLQQLGDSTFFGNACPAATRIGTISPYGPTHSGVIQNLGSPEAGLPLYNIVPERGHTAEFGFTAGANNVVLYADVVPSDGTYIVRLTSPGIQRVDPLLGVTATFFGDPGARDGITGSEGAFLTNGADCSASGQSVKLMADLWQAPGRYTSEGSPDLSDPNWKLGETTLPELFGCNELHFQPTIIATPETNRADTPTGLDVTLKVPQEEGVKALGTPPLKSAVIALPAGMTVNPSSANGLQGCSLGELGMSAAGVPDGTSPNCPDASKVGTVELETPALPGTLGGSIYLAKQSENPFGSLLALYVVIDDPATGVLVKLPGEIKADPSTGQLTTIVDNSPQFPFSALRTHFFGGAKAALRTPAVCGAYEVTSTLTPWSAPESGPAATPSSTFGITQGCAASAAQEPHNPAFAAGTVSPAAGAYSPFVLKILREDGSQELAGLNLILPPGLIGKLAGISQCSEAQLALAASRSGLGQGAAELASPSCPASSEVGTVSVGAGAGPTPYYATGHVYLAGPYKGAPFSLAVIVPAVAGPFDLGSVVVRSALRVDPKTAQITAVSDPIPTILAGIPLDVRSITLNVGRPGFTFNPTSCERKEVKGEAISIFNQIASLANPFQVTNCAALRFAPKFSVSTSSKTSKANGASLAAKVSYPSGSLGTQANIKSVKVTLPKALPSRLSTIQQACLQATFAANPAACPPGSNVGVATAHTPVLANPLTGPAYLVSHGGAAFPDLVVILQGEGVTLDLLGGIDIKKGVTSSTFASVPDAPISSFELSLPQGPHSALAATLSAKAHGNLCGTNLVMPTTLTGQNGAQVKQSTKIAVTGCPRAKKAKKAKHKRKAKRGKR
jgi:hypothetical protein